MDKISLHCFPIAHTRDGQEKQAQPFFFKTVGIPSIDHHIEVTLGHYDPSTDRGTLRCHSFKVIRVTFTESEIQLLVLEDRAQARDV